MPVELLYLIASNLNSHDLGNFRCVCIKLATASASLVARNGISVLNTSDSLKDLEEFLETDIAASARVLTVYHGEWQVCRRKDHAYVQDHYALKADEAFLAYANFIQKEMNRRKGDDIETIYHALSILNNLHTINISNVQTWQPTHNSKYHKLLKKIWLLPHRQGSINSSLGISGVFDATDVHLTAEKKFLHFEKLYVGSFQVLKSQDNIRLFLQAFPNLLHLSIGFQGWGPSIPDVIGHLFWPRLKTLCLKEIWASEKELLTIFTRHRSTLEAFSLHHGALTQGSWRSLFTRIRSMNTRIEVTAKGELYGRSSKHTIILHATAANVLAGFMKDQRVPWPFAPSSTSHDI
ncbi:hypothetical protein N431DRAFT_337655 [Stipitochalara longipes BDJ]|nr:hypothetical protein N431DRAFT_337655 [Stipitochalara longipes BDJ]